MSKTQIQQSQLHNSKDYTLPAVSAALESGATTLSDDLNALRAMVKNITGKSSWCTAADQDLAQIYGAVQVSGANTTMQGTLTVASGLTSLANLTASGVVDLSAAGQATTVHGTLEVAQLATFDAGVEIAADTLELANNSHMNLLGNADITVAALAGDGWVVRADGAGKLIDGSNMIFKEATGLDLFDGNFTVSPAGKVLVGGNEIQDSAGAKVISFAAVNSVTSSIIIENNARVKGDLVVDGDFNVQGTMTTIDTLNIKVKDAVIMLANGDPAPDTSGLVLHGAAGVLDLALGQHGKNGQWIMAKVDGAGVNGTDPQMNLVGADLAELIAGGVQVGMTEDVVLGSFAPVGAGSTNVSMTAANSLLFNVHGADAVNFAADAGEVTAFATRFSGDSLLAAIKNSSLAVDAEASRALSAEGSLASDLSSEASTARSAESVLTSDLSSEVSRAGSAEGVLTSDLSSEASRAFAAEGSIASNLSTEILRAESVETDLYSTISSEASTARSAESVLTSDLSSEASRALSAEGSLASDLSSEASRAFAAEGSLASDLSSEASRAFAAEGSLASDLSSEASTARSAESVLTSSISSEASRAFAAEGSLASDLSSEVSRAGSAEGVLTSSISSEASTARSAELVLTNDLSSEVSMARSVEAGLQSSIDAINAYVQDSFVVGTAMEAGAEVDFSASVGALAAGSFATSAAAKKVLDVYLNGVRLAYGAGKDYLITVAGKLTMSFNLEADDVFFLVNRAPAAGGGGGGGGGGG